MIIQIDAGNTRVKWRMMSAVDDIRSGVLCRTQLAPSLLKLVGGSNCVSQIQFSSVVSSEQNACLLSDLRQTFPGSSLFVAETAPEMAGLVVAYKDFGDLGVDRALAMLGALKLVQDGGRLGAFLVIDAGSALTADWVTSEGQHLGGYISCGYDMMRRALNQNTGRIRVDSGSVPDLRPGVTTVDCVSAGIATSYFKAIETWLLEASLRNACVFLTGGDAALVSSVLSSYSMQEQPDLVFEGLKIYADAAGDR